MAPNRMVRTRRYGLLAGPLAALTILYWPPPEGLSQAGWITAAIALVMAIWWMSEALPLAATALLPVALFPLLGLVPFEDLGRAYAHPLIFLFFGGLILAKGLEKWQLHRRLALFLLSYAGDRPSSVIGAVMAATAFLSMWVSNTATAMVMLPIALSIASTFTGPKAIMDASQPTPFGSALMLAVAYSATIGGMGTLIGTPPNALFAGFMLETYGISIGFAQWMLVGLPAVLILLPITWVLLTQVLFTLPARFPQPEDGPAAAGAPPLGPMARQHYMVAGVMSMVALLWLTRPLVAHLAPELPLSDAGIAMAGALILFVLPDQWPKGTFLLSWKDVSDLRFDVLILFGGGLALANAIAATGLAAWIGSGIERFQDLPTMVLILVIMATIVYLGELASNTAMAAVFLPVAGAAAVGLGEPPLSLALPVVLAASLGFMLPVATPPNAIVYGSGAVPAQTMLRAGAILDVVSLLLVFGLAMTLGRLVFG
ncbi:MAG: DASS family sodium-coupled anion symporter [Roseibium sp.]|nr:DASS family sodium-coupled anion symporter [Roseibium sp.]